MEIVGRLRVYGVQAYFFMFFFILFFRHKNIDLVRIPFFLLIIWQMFKKKLSPKFLIDPVSVAIFSFVLTAAVSNTINGIPLDEIVKIANWLFPFYLGKYVIMRCPEIELENILSCLLICATAFSVIGIAGYLMGWDTIFGRPLFDAGRYRFTISGTNRAGFYLGISLVLGTYFFVRRKISFDVKYLLAVFCWMTIFASLFLIKERKTILTVMAIVTILLLVYRRYKVVIVGALALALVLSVIPIPERYHPRQMALNVGMLGRFNAWETAIGLFREKPVFGHGYPSFKEACRRYNEENGDKLRFKKFQYYSIAHNLSLNALAETGFLGFLALNAVFFNAWRFYRYRHRDKSLFILGVTIGFIYVTMQFGNFVHSTARTDLAFLIVGLYLSFERYRQSGTVARPVGADNRKEGPEA
ncbi:MAG: O-antigen ligase family protein [Deltaproteobacteria bacterium]|nr:O-antigen ligase family protein [Deltaproteobacteria bacterium]